MTVATFLRRAILTAVTNGRVQVLVRKHGMRLGAARFVAGETLDECLDVLERLNAQGLDANTTLLGEDVASAAEARAVADEYDRILGRITERGVQANVALKLTHLGLLVDEQAAYENVSRVVDAAAARSNFVRIDMEHSAVVDAILRIYRRLRESGRDNVGVVLQSYLYRSEADLAALLPLRPNVRIVKGAYLEPPELAYPRKKDVDEAYVRLVEAALHGGAYAAVATHDRRLIEHVIELARGGSIADGRFEFQMLYGVRPELQLALVRRGYRVRVATPFGPEWYPYLMRRLAERPANLGFVLRNLLPAH